MYIERTYSGIEDLDRFIEDTREGDYFSFIYNDKIREEARKNNHDLNWCFDRQLIFKKWSPKAIKLHDTYWSTERSSFDIKKLLLQGTLIFICNINDTKKISKDDRKYYKEEDIFDLSYQHGYYEDFHVKIDAKRDPTKILLGLQQAIEKEKSSIEYSRDRIKTLEEKIKKLEEEGLEDIYF